MCHNDILRLSLLYDYYSELLTEKQRQFIYKHRQLDHSLAEIAEEEDITPQAVRDHIVRAEQKLMFYESKLKLVENHEAVNMGNDHKELHNSKHREQIYELEQEMDKLRVIIPDERYMALKKLVKDLYD